jgi:hypothetical protein
MLFAARTAFQERKPSTNAELQVALTNDLDALALGMRVGGSGMVMDVRLLIVLRPLVNLVIIVTMR